MPEQLIRRYSVTCGLLLLPILIGNAAFADRLPSAISDPQRWGAIPAPLSLAENALRILVFAVPFVMPLRVSTRRQRYGLALFIVGSLVYAASWAALIEAPRSLWSNSAAGFLAPACTPVLWLLGIALVGQEFSWGKPCPPWMYASLSLAFVAAHAGHAAVVYAHNHTAGP